MKESSRSPAAAGEGFARALRQAIAEHGFTLHRLHAALEDRGSPVSMTTLSYWRTGERHPEGARSLAAVAELESLLALDPGSLASLLGPSRRVGPIGPADDAVGEERLNGIAAAMMEELAGPAPSVVRDVSSHVVTVVGPDGGVRTRTTRSIIQSTDGLLSEFPYIEMSPGHAMPRPEFRAIAGVRILRELSDPGGEVHGLLVALEQPVDTAGTTVIEWELEYPALCGVRTTGHAVARQCRDVLLWTRFHPDAVPDRLEEIERTAEGTHTTTLALSAGTAVHQTRRRFGPGLLALEWSYDETAPDL